MEIKYLIVDDEPLAHDVIKTFAKNIGHLTLIDQCYDAFEALKILKSNQIDLIFLDIEMPKLKGFDFIKTLSYKPNIIITTAYEEYALEGYELEVIDYLLKPFSFERFLKAVNKLNTKPKYKPQTIAQTKNATTFIKTDSGLHQIEISSIQYLESLGNYVKIHLKDNHLITHNSLQHFEHTLNPDKFVRIHKSYIVSIAHVKRVTGNIIFVDNEKLPIGRSYKLSFQRKIRNI